MLVGVRLRMGSFGIPVWNGMVIYVLICLDSLAEVVLMIRAQF